MSIDLDRQLVVFGEHIDEAYGPLTVEEILGRGEAPVRPLPVPERRRLDPRTLWVAAAAAVAVLVLVGLPVLVAWLNREAPLPPQDTTTTVVDSTTSTTEPGSEGPGDAGTIETDVGAVNWWHVSGDLPFPYGLVSTPTGFLAMSGSQFMRSIDGREWFEEPFPVPAEPEGLLISESGGEFWLTSRGVSTAWRSVDGENWSAVSLPTPEPPAITGVEWTVQVGAPAVVGGRAVIPLDLNGAVDWATLLDVPIGSYGAWDDEEPGTMGIWSGAEYAQVAAVTVEQDGNRVSFFDAESGEFVHEIVIADDRFDVDTLIESRSGFAFVQGGLVVVDGSGQTASVVAPWQRPTEQYQLSTRVFGLDDRFFAYVQRGDLGSQVTEVWTSTDGRTWDGPQPTGFGDGSLLITQQEDGSLVAQVFAEDGGIWVSEDGVSWVDTGLDTSQYSWDVFRSGSGWLALDAGSGLAQVSTDLGTWETVDIGEMKTRIGDEFVGSAGTKTAGGTIFFIQDQEGVTARELWVLEVEG